MWRPSLVAIITSALCTPLYAAAPEREWEDDQGIFTFSFENDTFGGEDNGYTSGARLSWMTPEKSAPDWVVDAANAMPFIEDKSHKRVGFAFGQNIYTPDDKSVRAAIPNDRPYAGWLYGSVGVVADTGRTLDSYQLTLGVVGPLASAQHTQKFVHHLIDAEIPQGWDNQLENEPGIVLTYDHKWKGFYRENPFGISFDVTPNVGASIGNIYTNATAGVVVRLGEDLPEDYGPPLINPSLMGSDFFIPSDSFGWYIFGGAEGKAVARNIFLDGNTFESGPSVDKKNLVGALQTGIALTFGANRLSYTHTFLTKEFDQQNHPDNYGALTFSRRF